MSSAEDAAQQSDRHERIARFGDDLEAWRRDHASAHERVLPNQLEVEPGTWLRTQACSADMLRAASDARLLEGRQLIGSSEHLRKALRLIWEADELYALAEERDAEAEDEAAEG
jgi:hypothetical protein